MSVGKRIQQIRLKNDLSLKGFGKIISVADTMVMRWERGEIAVPFEMIISISKKFGYSPNWFAGMED